MLLALGLAQIAVSQIARGKISTIGKKEPLIGATILEEGTSNGVISGIDGSFSLQLTTDPTILIVSYAGFKKDTVAVYPGRFLDIQLMELTAELGEVVVKAKGTYIENRTPLQTEVITQAELTKAACCNLSESFDTNASVDVSYSDAITGAKTIQMLGLEGRYVQLNREGVPNVRGLAGRYGLSFIPGPWIQAIDVGKGTGTVVNGYESMTGQINVELKKPENSDKLYLNGYVNSFGRSELNALHGRKMGERWYGGLLLHANHLNTEIDQNDDGFMDLPKSRQINLINRYKYVGEKLRSQIGFAIMRDEKAGGQLGFGFGDDFKTSVPYGFQNNTTRLEVFGKMGLVFPQKPYKGWGLIYSASYMDVESGFGRRSYSGQESTLYANMIFQNILGNTAHQYKTGMSFLVDDFDEQFVDSTFTRTEVVPGIYYEYSFVPNDRITLMLGARTDFHNLYGTYFTPRLHFRYALTDQTTFRVAGGRGYRTPNVLIENSNVLVSSRALMVLEEPLPEVSWNVGASLVTSTEIANRDLSLTLDYYHTTFENQLVYDMDASSNALSVYNLDGDSYAHSFQLEGQYEFSERLSGKAAYKYYNVKTTINGALRDMPFISRDRVFLNLAYATKFEKWKADYTLHWFGTQRLPDTLDKPDEFQQRNQSPHYFHMNAQVTRGFRWGAIYLGAENLLDFTQGNPIIDAENPFGNEFDASIVWAPIAGRMIYAGFRYRIKD